MKRTVEAGSGEEQVGVLRMVLGARTPRGCRGDVWGVELCRGMACLMRAAALAWTTAELTDG